MKWNTLKKWLTIGDSTVRQSHGGSHQKIRTCPKCLSNQVTNEDGENFCLKCYHFWKNSLVKGGQGRSAESVEASGKFVVVSMIFMAVILIVVAICSG